MNHQMLTQNYIPAFILLTFFVSMNTEKASTELDFVFRGIPSAVDSVCVFEYSEKNIFWAK